MAGNQGRSAGATTREGGGMPEGEVGDVLSGYAPVVEGNAPEKRLRGDRAAERGGTQEFFNLSVLSMRMAYCRARV